jgi:hypothetical protein
MAGTTALGFRPPIQNLQADAAGSHRPSSLALPSDVPCCLLLWVDKKQHLLRVAKKPHQLQMIDNQ